MPGQFLGGDTTNLAGGMIIPRDDRSVMSQHGPWSLAGRQPASPWRPGVLWAPSGGMGGRAGGMLNADAASYGQWGTDTNGHDESGGQQMVRITGMTRDSSGNALGSCVVKLFRTSDGLFVNSTTSDAGGWYELRTPYLATNHYVVAYQAGSPDVAGTSVNTLQGS